MTFYRSSIALTLLLLAGASNALASNLCPQSFFGDHERQYTQARHLHVEAMKRFKTDGPQFSAPFLDVHVSRVLSKLQAKASPQSLTSASAIKALESLAGQNYPYLQTMEAILAGLIEALPLENADAHEPPIPFNATQAAQLIQSGLDAKLLFVPFQYKPDVEEANSLLIEGIFSFELPEPHSSSNEPGQQAFYRFKSSFYTEGQKVVDIYHPTDTTFKQSYHAFMDRLAAFAIQSSYHVSVSEMIDLQLMYAFRSGPPQTITRPDKINRFSKKQTDKGQFIQTMIAPLGPRQKARLKKLEDAATLFLNRHYPR